MTAVYDEVTSIRELCELQKRLPMAKTGIDSLGKIFESIVEEVKKKEGSILVV